MGKATAMNQEIGAPLEFAELKGEAFRRYHFPNGVFTVENVIGLCIRPSGTHRLNTADGRKFVVPTGWLAIEVGAESWSV
jgi:hypothetical protein